jgi:ATP-binding cassette subfamily F protein uup
LEDYLDAFKGCIIVVSHDRYFLDRVTDHLFVFDEDRIIKFPGNYSYFLLVKKYRNDEGKKKKLESRKQKIVKLSDKFTYKDKRELKLIELEIPEIEKQIITLNNKIEKEASNLSPTDFREITNMLKELQQKLDELESRWLELDEKN